jgi:L-ascorbate metabolism protein UlaG (beta-lactamase superfamily)
MDMQLIGESTRLAFAALCIGGTFTMDAADAVTAARFVNCGQIVGVHYDTYPPIKIDHGEARKLFQAAGKKLHLLKIGESREF